MKHLSQTENLDLMHFCVAERTASDSEVIAGLVWKKSPSLEGSSVHPQRNHKILWLRAETLKTDLDNLFLSIIQDRG